MWKIKAEVGGTLKMVLGRTLQAVCPQVSTPWSGCGSGAAGIQDRDSVERWLWAVMEEGTGALGFASVPWGILGGSVPRVTWS